MSIKISQLTSAVDVTANDLVQIIDVEDGVMAPSGTNKKVTASLLANQLVPLIDNGAIAGSKLADGGITSSKILDGTIVDADISASANIAGSKIADGSITSAKILDGTIVDADISASAAIAGTKVAPDFGSQNIVTTGTLSANVGSVISGSSSGDALRITQTGAGNALVVEDSTNPDSTPFLVSSTGEVGIGTTAPNNSRLHVVGVGITQGLKVESTTTAQHDGTRILMRGVAGTVRSSALVHQNLNVGGTESSFNINSYGSGDNYLSTMASYDYSVNSWRLFTDSSERVRITSAGNVGIGTTPPTFQLQLSTDSAAKPSTSTWTVSSDERLKENIELADIDICYNAVKSIPLKRYKWKDEFYSADQVADRHKLGWIAQDVQAVFPKAVGEHKFTYNQVMDEDGKVESEDSIDDCLSLNADQLYAALFGAVQKLMGTVESLQARIDELEQVG